MTEFNEKRRYKCVGCRGDGKHYFEQNWSDDVQEAPGWFREKKDAAKAWDDAHAPKPPPEPSVQDKRRAALEKARAAKAAKQAQAEIVTGIVEE